MFSVRYKLDLCMLCGLILVFKLAMAISRRPLTMEALYVKLKLSLVSNSNCSLQGEVMDIDFITQIVRPCPTTFNQSILFEEWVGF